MSDHKYRLLYMLKPVPDGITKTGIEELNKVRPNEQWGACDALVLMSLLYPEDGSLSMMVVPLDGRPEAAANELRLEDHELFKVWTLLAHRLMDSETLGDGPKGLCRAVHETMVESFRAFHSRGGLPS